MKKRFTKDSTCCTHIRQPGRISYSWRNFTSRLFRSCLQPLPSNHKGVDWLLKFIKLIEYLHVLLKSTFLPSVFPKILNSAGPRCCKLHRSSVGKGHQGITFAPERTEGWQRPVSLQTNNHLFDVPLSGFLGRFVHQMKCAVQSFLLLISHTGVLRFRNMEDRRPCPTGA